MKYFIIAGEASGDIHGAQLIRSLREQDTDAQIHFLGGDLMAAQAGTQPIIHYRDMAFMGFIEVAKHLGSILGFMKRAKQEIDSFAPDAVILIDYPSFNLKIARYAHSHGIPTYYFISPKVWAWKEYRVRDIKRYVRRVFSILPFEVDFYRKHNYDVCYVGNPTVKEIDEATADFSPKNEFCAAHGLDSNAPIIAIVPGSRQKEIRDNLPTMLSAARQITGFQIVIAGAPGIDPELYRDVAGESLDSPIVQGHTFQLVHHATAALVTSGTATLETALLGTPQVACYRMNGSKLLYRLYSLFIKGKYVTLPNLITDSPLIPELLLHHCTPHNILHHLRQITAPSPQLTAMQHGYARLRHILGTQDCAATTAAEIIKELKAGRPKQ